MTPLSKKADCADTTSTTKTLQVAMFSAFRCCTWSKTIVAAAAEPAESIKLAKDFVETMNRHDNTKVQTLFTEDSTVKFPETELTARCVFESYDMVMKSFPDFRLEATGFHEVGPCGVVGFTVVASGTHTGEPYAFGPFPSIKASGKVCRNDPEIYTVTIEDGRIKRCDVTPTGELFGLAGLYTQVGGLVI